MHIKALFNMLRQRCNYVVLLKLTFVMLTAAVG